MNAQKQATTGMDSWLKRMATQPPDEKAAPMSAEEKKTHDLTDREGPRACVPVWPRERLNYVAGQLQQGSSEQPRSSFSEEEGAGVVHESGQDHQV